MAPTSTATAASNTPERSARSLPGTTGPRDEAENEAAEERDIHAPFAFRSGRGQKNPDGLAGDDNSAQAGGDALFGPV